MGYQLKGMAPDVPMVTGMALIGIGLVAALHGLKAPGNPHGHPAAAWLPLVGITGTVLAETRRRGLEDIAHELGAADLEPNPAI